MQHRLDQNGKLEPPKDRTNIMLGLGLLLGVAVVMGLRWYFG